MLQTRRRKKAEEPTNNPADVPTSIVDGSVKIRTNGRVREVVVSVGPQTFSPIEYHSFQVAPLSVTIELAEDDVIADVVADAQAMLRRLQHQEFDFLKAEFAKFARDAQEAVREYRARAAG